MRLVLALFAAATVLVSSCATACFGAQFTAANTQKPSEHCDHPGKPAGKEAQPGDCSQHGHPTDYVKDRGAAKLDPLFATAFAAALPEVAIPSLAGPSATPQGRDHAPFAPAPLYETDCSLRI